MTKRNRFRLTALLAGLALSAAVGMGLVARAESVPVSELQQQTHIHGLAASSEAG